MDKKKLLEKICAELETQLETLKESARLSYDAATNEESRPENEYDTRALEASYLSAGQGRRVRETEAALTACRFLQPRDFSSGAPIAAAALIEVSLDDRRSRIFLVPAGGGLSVEFEGHSIQVVTAKSPLGEALLGQRAGDVATVEKGDQVLEYEILSVE